MARSSRRRSISKPPMERLRKRGLLSPALTRLSQKYVTQCHARIAFTDIYQAEYRRYKQTCLVDGITIPTRAKLMQKIDDINALVNRSWTEAELHVKLTKSGALINKFVPIERKRLGNLVKDARAQGDLDAAERFQAELDALDGPKLAFGSSMQPASRKGKAGVLTQQERLAELNRQHRRENAEKVRQAQIAERKKVKAEQAKIARGEEVTEDTSRRVKTIAKFKHDIADAYVKKTGSDASGANTPSGTPKLGAKKTALPHLAKMQAEQNAKKGLPTIRRPVMDDDIIGAIDLGIDIDLEL
jgi:RNA polymerase-associated protein RTF1